MAGFIRKEDIIDPLIAKLLEELAIKTKAFGDELDRIASKSGNAKDLSGLKSVILATEETIELTKQLEKTKADLKKATEQLANVFSAENKALIATNEALRKSKAEISESITGKKALAKATKEAADETKRLTKERNDQIAAVKSREQAEQKELEAINRKTAAIKKLTEAQQLQRAKLVSTAQQYPTNTVENVNARIKIAEFDKSIVSTNDKGLIDRESAFIKKLNDEKKKLIATNKELELSDKQAAKSKQLLISAQNAEKGSAQQLIAVNKILAERMKTINVLTTEGAAKYKQLDAAMQRNKGKIAEMNQAAQQQGSMFRNLAQSIITYAAAYVSVQSVIQLGQSIVTQTKELDKLSFSLKAVIKDSDELALTQAFLSNVATKYGSDLLSISERYIKFRTAAMQANLSAVQTQKIFDSVSKAAGVLGLKTDETAGIYLALEQMLSKGKVTTEELRRQLGERLPGSFGIMAKTLGVTLPQLDKMLRMGQIMSAEVLPKFAQQIEIAFGIENVNKIDTLTAATGRFTTAWTLLVSQLQASRPIMMVTNWMTDLLTLTSTGIDIATNKGRNLLNIIQRIPMFSDKVIDQIKKFDALTFQELKNENERRIKIGEDGILWKQYYQQRITQEKLLQKETSKAKEYDVDKFKAEIEAKKKSYDELAKLTDKNSREQFKQNQAIYEENYKAELAAQLKTVKALEMVAQYKVKKDPKSESALFSQKSLVEERLFLEMELFDATKDLRKKDIIDAKAYAKELEKAQKDGLKISYEAKKEMDDNLIDEEKALQDEIKKIGKDMAQGKKEMTDKVIYDETAYADESKLLAQETAFAQIKAAKGKKDEIERINHELQLSSISSDIKMYNNIMATAGLEVDAYTWAAQKKRELMLQFGKEELDYTGKTEEEKNRIRNEKIQAWGQFVNEGFNFTKQLYANQAAYAEETYNRELKAAGDSVEAQIIAKRKYEEEDKKLKHRQAIADKLSALFNIGLNLAIALSTPNLVTKVPLILAAGIAAANVIATPIPQYFKGTENLQDETFIAGDKGKEAIIKPSGEVLITPDKATLFSDKSFLGSTILPNDKTQRMLANYAVNQGASVFVDMSVSNKHLASMDEQMKKREPITYMDSKGRQFIKRGSVTTQLV